MAASVAMHPILGNPLSKSRFTPSVLPSKFVPCFQRKTRVQVRCKAEEENKDDLASQLTQLTPPTLPKGDIIEPPLTRLTPPPLEKVSPDFFDVFSFVGPGPERINGRLAMIGFVSAMAIELTKGQDLFTQISSGGYLWFFWSSILFTAASLIPFSKGMGPAAKSNSFWNPDAEIWNGRAAMVGLVALAFTELVKGGPLV